MKKIFKSVGMICLALIMLCPLALVGCDKNYKINIEITEGSGFVYKKNIEGASVSGRNTVDKGDKFEYFVTPDTGYEIDKVIVDGKPQTGFEKTGAYFCFENVKANHSVKISFITARHNVEFYCVGAGGAYELYKEVPVNHEANLDLNHVTYGGEANTLWYKI